MNKVNPKISIIVPMYNCAEYAPKCIDNIINQTYDNWELILVHGDSKDGTEDVCIEYEKKDSRITNIFHIDGLVAARNVGFDKITGDWHMYIDGDDWIDLETCEKLVKFIQKYDRLDVIFWKFLQDRNGNSVKSKMEWKCKDQERLYIGKECHELAKHTMIYSSGITTAYAKLINTEWAKKYSIKHDDRLRQGEEGVEFSLRLFYYANRVLFINSYWNHYRYVENGLSKSINEKNATWITDCFMVMEEDIEKFDNKNEVRKMLFQRVVYGLIAIAMNIYFNPNNKECLSKRINKFKSLIIDNPIYRESIKRCPLTRMDKFRIITLYIIKLRLYFLLDPIGRVKQYMISKGKFTY